MNEFAVVVPNAVVKTPVEGLYVSGYVALKEVEEILLLKRDQSVVERRPRFVALAVGTLKVMVAPEPVIVKSVPVVLVAKSAVPVVVCPAGPTASTPVFVTLPALYERPDENVVVATHDGTPLTQERT